MVDLKLAKLANSGQNENMSGISTTESLLQKAIMTLIRELKVKNGSLKVFVHNGEPGSRVEIQNKILKDI